MLYRVNYFFVNKTNKNASTKCFRYRKQIATFEECFWLCREQLLEAIHCLNIVSQNVPALRIVLWGQFGTGKSITLQQLIHFAHTQDYVIISEKEGNFLNSLTIKY